MDLRDFIQTLARGGSDSEMGVASIFEKAKKDHAYLERYKALRAKLEHKIDMLNLRVLVLTSAVAGEGKTVSAVNLALNFAKAGRKKVLLVDMDLRKADLARMMGVKPVPGLSEFLTGSATHREILRDSRVDGLYVIPAGTRISDPADLLAGERFRGFVQDVRTHFDVVLLDTPPVIPVADTLCLRDLADGFVFVYRAGFTPHPLLRQALEEIGEKNILGVVINGVEPQKDSYYQKYYGRYYVKNKEESASSGGQGPK